jgi:hypothetical protein
MASTGASTPAPRGGADARGWPSRPFVEGPELDAQLDRASASDEVRAFAHELADTGLGRLDLGDEGRALCDAVSAEIDPLFDDPKVMRVQDAWLRSRAVRKLATLPKVVDALTTIYGRPAFPFQTLNFHRGSQQGLHADAIHFHSDPPLFMCGVWIALEDITADAGPLTYVEGSHKLPVMTMRSAGVNHDQPDQADYERTYAPALDAQLKASGLPQRQALPKKGEAVVWAANLAHGGAPILNPEATRRSLVTHYYFADCVYYTPIFSDVEAGRLAVRLPANVATGGWAWPRRDGRPVKPNVGAFIGCCRKLLTRQPIVTRAA